MVRVVDLSQAVEASPGPAPYHAPPHYNHHEYLDDNFHRSELMGLVDVDRLDLGDDGQPCLEVTMSVDPMGSHAELYWLDDRVMFGRLPADKRHLIRDVTQLPIQRMCGPAAIVDLTDFGPGEEIGVRTLEERGAHIRRDDIVILKTGYSEAVNEKGLKFSQDNYEASPGLSAEAGSWLAQRGIKALAMDTRSPEVESKVWKDPDRTISFPVHRTMHEIGAVIVEDLTNVTRVKSSRVYAVCGMPLKASGLSGGAARFVVVDDQGNLTDLSNPISSHPRDLPALATAGRSEDWARRAEIFRRLRIQKISFTGLGYGYPGGMPDWAEFVTFNTRLGTHVIAPSRGDATGGATHLSPRQVWGSARVARVPGAGPESAISAADLESALSNGYGGEAVIIRTAYSDWHYTNPEYWLRSPYLTVDAVDWLVAHKAPLVVCDFPSVDSACDSLAAPRQQALLDAGIPVVLSATNLWMLRRDTVTLACLSLPIEGLDNSPVRLVAFEGAIDRSAIESGT
jgi:arylformamidase